MIFSDAEVALMREALDAYRDTIASRRYRADDPVKRDEATRLMHRISALRAKVGAVAPKLALPKTRCCRPTIYGEQCKRTATVMVRIKGESSWVAMCKSHVDAYRSNPRYMEDRPVSDWEHRDLESLSNKEEV